MPPLPPTTSPVAIATARILAAYLSNHDLSPAEAASLNGTIVETLLGLAREAPVTSHPVPRLAEEPTPRRRTKVQANWQASAEAEPTAPETEFVAEAEAELEAEAMAEPDDSPVLPPDPGWASEPDAPAEAAEAADLPRKRKRPSRPRSRRGQVATPPTASEAPSDDEPQVGPPETEPYRTQSEMAVTPGLADADADADVPAEGEEIAPKPRRMPNRARRTTTS